MIGAPPPWKSGNVVSTIIVPSGAGDTTLLISIVWPPMSDVAVSVSLLSFHVVLVVRSIVLPWKSSGLGPAVPSSL